jgi:undecaprenyl diphosphate synthase/tritrans,polycis-undecaprenyl-diphosphate synthase [geranylgeranyl-diphosphate specific]
MVENDEKKTSPYREYIKELSIYGLSADNINRDDDTTLMIEKCLQNILIDENIPWADIHVQFIGDRHLLPHNIATICDMIERKCSGDFVISVALGYSPHADAKLIVQGGEGAGGDEENIGSSARPKQSPIDLVIRTGGEKRSSGFFPLHTTYSEWIYTNKLFPDLTESDLNSFMKEFFSRKRNFGK